MADWLEQALFKLVVSILVLVYSKGHDPVRDRARIICCVVYSRDLPAVCVCVCVCMCELVWEPN